MIKIGHKKFLLDQNDDTVYLAMISSKLAPSVIQNRLFTNDEIQVILRKAQERCLVMKIPNMEYVIMNTWDNLKHKDFFCSQEILLGKTICDISLSDP